MSQLPLDSVPVCSIFDFNTDFILHSNYDSISKCHTNTSQFSNFQTLLTLSSFLPSSIPFLHHTSSLAQQLLTIIPPILILFARIFQKENFNPRFSHLETPRLLKQIPKLSPRLLDLVHRFRVF